MLFSDVISVVWWGITLVAQDFRVPCPQNTASSTRHRATKYYFSRICRSFKLARERKVEPRPKSPLFVLATLQKHHELQSPKLTCSTLATTASYFAACFRYQ
jgi:hypothetical protein